MPLRSAYSLHFLSWSEGERGFCLSVEIRAYIAARREVRFIGRPRLPESWSLLARCHAFGVLRNLFLLLQVSQIPLYEDWHGDNIAEALPLRRQRQSFFRGRLVLFDSNNWR